jgi:type VII secretion integral membrane protein EccD
VGGDAVGDSLCRLTVQCGVDAVAHAVDLALPTMVDVCQLMPSIVDIIDQDGTAPVTGRRWRLSRAGGMPVDESMTLEENEVRDGDVLLLTAIEPPAPVWRVADPSHTVAHVDTANGGPAMRALSVSACLLAGAIGATALVWSALVTASAQQLVIAAGLAVAAAAGAVVARRTHTDPLLCVTLSVTAVVYAGATGFLAVPGAPSAAHVLLASAAAFAMTMFELRLISCGTICLTAIAAFALLTAMMAAASLTWHWPADAAGAVLATLALATLGVSARLSIAVAGIGPPVPSTDDLEDDGPAADDAARPVRGHRILTGLVIGSSISAALGAILVAYGEDSLLHAAAFTAVIGLALLLRSRTHADTKRRVALAVGGMLTITAGFAVSVVNAPSQAHWISLVAAAGGAGALGGLLDLTISPVARRAVEIMEYLALAAVVPLACWVGGLYGLVRDLGLI